MSATNRRRLLQHNKNRIRKAPSTSSKRGFSYYSNIKDTFLLYHFVCLRIRENNCRFKRLGFLKIHQCVRHDNNNIIRLHLTCRSTIQANFARTAFTFDNVGFKALAVIVIGNIHFLPPQSCLQRPANPHQS